MEEHYKQVLSDIKEYGWHVVLVIGDGGKPPFAYSVGFYHSYQHPEVIIFGLSLDTMHAILNIIGGATVAGVTYETGQEYADILEGYNCIFRPVSKEWYQEYLGVGNWFYEGLDYPAIQCFWPDKYGRFPWDVEVEEHWRARQPVLEA